jgi:hypothetical protein
MPFSASTQRKLIMIRDIIKYFIWVAFVSTVLAFSVTFFPPIAKPPEGGSSIQFQSWWIRPPSMLALTHDDRPWSGDALHGHDASRLRCDYACTARRRGPV